MRSLSCHVRQGYISLEMLEVAVIDGEERYCVRSDAKVSCCGGEGILDLPEGVWHCSLKPRLSRLMELKVAYQVMWEKEFPLKVSDKARKLVDQSLREGKGFRIAGQVGKPTALLWECAIALVWHYGIPAYIGRIGDGLVRPRKEHSMVFVDGFAGQKLGSLEVMVGWCYGACLPFWVSECGLHTQKSSGGRFAKRVGQKTSQYRQTPWFEKTSDPSLKRKLWNICHNELVT